MTTTSAYTISDSEYSFDYEIINIAEREYIEYCFDCNLPLKITYKNRPLSSIIDSINIKDSIGYYFIKEGEYNDMKIIGIEILTEKEKIKKERICNYTTIIMPNGSKDIEDVCNIRETKYNVYIWIPLNDTHKIKYGEDIIINFKGKTMSRTGVKASDLIPSISFSGKTLYMDKIAWWNNTFNYKLPINCSNMTDETPIIVNGSGGFNIGGEKQYVWTYCSGIGTAIYFNTYSDYVIANNTDQLPMEVEVGNGSDYLSTEVWNTSLFEFISVWHLSESSGNAIDSTDYGEDGVVDGTQGVAGRIGNAVDLDGVSDEIIVSTYPLDTTQLTFYFWFNSNLLYTHSDRSFFCLGDIATDFLGVWSERVLGDGVDGLGMYEKLANDYDDYPPASLISYKKDTWYQVVAWYDETPDDMVIYLNDSFKGNEDMDGDLSRLNGDTLYIGKRFLGDMYFNGTLDEIRILHRTLTPQEINQTYQNAIGISGFGDLGILETKIPNNTPNITLIHPPDNSIDISINPELEVNVIDLDNDSMTVFFYNASNNTEICNYTNISNNTDVSCIWSDLNFNTTYEWYVSVSDGSNISTSSIWNFTTKIKYIGGTLYYMGYEKFCIDDYSGNHTCLSFNESYNLTQDYDYWFTLYYGNKKPDIINFMGFMSIIILQLLLGVVLVGGVIWFYKVFI